MVSVYGKPFTLTRLAVPSIVMFPSYYRRFQVGPGSRPKWTVLGQSGRFEGVKVDGRGSKRTVQKGLKWTAPKSKSGRSFGLKLEGL